MSRIRTYKTPGEITYEEKKKAKEKTRTFKCNEKGKVRVVIRKHR
jgi:hypothetical protein